MISILSKRRKTQDARRKKITCLTVLFGWAILAGGGFWLADSIDILRHGVDAVTAATRPGQSVVGSVASDYPLLDRPQPRTTVLDADGVLTLVRWSNSLAYGLANVAPPGTTSILLLPTVRDEATTDVNVVRAVIQVCREAFHRTVITLGVPGHSQIPQNYRAMVDEVSTSLDLQVVALRDTPSMPLPSPTALLQRSYDLPQPLVMADAVILIPALWRDDAGTVHGSLDVLTTLIPGMAPGDSVCVDLVSAIAPLYVFADALHPHIGTVTKGMNAILAGNDLCSVDAVAAQLLGGTPSDVPGLSLAVQHGLGNVAWDDIKLNGMSIPGVPQEVQPFQGPAGPARPGR